MAKNPLRITDTILRDAHQSQAATRMRIEDMLPACEKLDNMGYWSLECWGGATFDVCMRLIIRNCRRNILISSEECLKGQSRQSILR